MGAGGQLNALGLSSNQQKGERNNSFERINESHADDTVFIVGGYTRCELLAHTPKDESKIGDDDDEENASFSVEERKASKKEENTVWVKRFFLVYSMIISPGFDADKIGITT